MLYHLAARSRVDKTVAHFLGEIESLFAKCVSPAFTLQTLQPLRDMRHFEQPSFALLIVPEALRSCSRSSSGARSSSQASASMPSFLVCICLQASGLGSDISHRHDHSIIMCILQQENHCCISTATNCAGCMLCCTTALSGMGAGGAAGWGTSAISGLALSAPLVFLGDLRQ